MIGFGRNNFHFHFVSTHAYTFALQFLLLVFTGTFQSHKFVYHLVLFSCLLFLSMLSSFNFRWQFVIDYDCFSFFDIKKKKSGRFEGLCLQKKMQWTPKWNWWRDQSKLCFPSYSWNPLTSIVSWLCQNYSILSSLSFCKMSFYKSFVKDIVGYVFAQIFISYHVLT